MPYRVKRGASWFIVVDDEGVPVPNARILRGFDSEGEQSGLHEPRYSGPETFVVEIDGVVHRNVPYEGD